MRVLVFGASGLLGRAVMRTFGTGHATGTCFRRVRPGLITVDATSREAILRALDLAQPDVVVSCIGERRPEVWADAPAVAEQLNVEVARHIAEGARRFAARLLHISSDYVFDGTTPPYRPDAVRNPLNAYGRWKALAEDVVLGTCPRATILRLPVLYGPAEYAAESNVTQIAHQVAAGRTIELDDVCVRYPTHVDEAAEVCRSIAVAQANGQRFGQVVHWTAQEGYTKYRMGLMIAQHFGIKPGHITAGAADAGAGDRPVDCRLDRQALVEALRWSAHRDLSFADEFPQVVAPWLRSA